MNIYYISKYAIIQDQNGSPFSLKTFGQSLSKPKVSGFCPNKINNHPNDLILQDYHMHVINLEEPRGNQKPQNFRPYGEPHHKTRNIFRSIEACIRISGS